MLIRIAGIVASIAVFAVAGCASVGDRAEAAAGVAVRLLAAVADDDGGAACGTLAPETLKTVAEDEPCDKAILDVGLPRPGPVEKTAVYGQWAQVRLTDDTVFLAVFPGGWRVVAAGCTARGERPYECVVEKG